MPVSQTGFETALQFLRSGISTGGLAGPSGRIPTVNAMARRARVSSQAMCRAVRSLVSEGEVRIVGKRGIYLCGAFAPETAVPAPPHCKWERLRTAIETDILNGAYSSSASLPSAGVLAQRYGVTYLTLRKALMALAADRLLSPSRSSFTINRPTAGTKHSSLVAVGVAGAGTGLFFRSHRNEEFFAVLERECSSRNIRLEKAIVRRRTSRREVFYTAGPPFNPQKAGAIGYLVMAESLGDTTGVLNLLGGTRRPVAVLDETGEVDERRLPLAPAHACVFSAANSKRCGLLAGQHLLRAGHRRICYLSAYHSNAWSVNRFLGLREAFGNAGFPGAVVPCVFSEYVNSWSIPPAPVERALRGRVPFGRIRGLMRSLERIGAGMPAHARKGFRFLSVRLAEAAHHEIERQYVLPLLEKALGVADATAWAASSDQTALFALDFLDSKGIQVPRRLSVMGFDDILEAFDSELTTYNFNMPALAHRILSFILDPRPRGRTSPPERVEIDGVVIERATTGRPAGK
jgi:DNA-binding LacI/PurR family transcriptional regulator/DNA-binding transcriptional regulator YhcF (GntR family)